MCAKHLCVVSHDLSHIVRRRAKSFELCENLWLFVSGSTSRHSSFVNCTYRLEDLAFVPPCQWNRGEKPNIEVPACCTFFGHGTRTQFQFRCGSRGAKTALNHETDFRNAGRTAQTIDHRPRQPTTTKQSKPRRIENSDPGGEKRGGLLHLSNRTHRFVVGVYTLLSKGVKGRSIFSFLLHQAREIVERCSTDPPDHPLLLFRLAPPHAPRPSFFASRSSSSVLLLLLFGLDR